MLSSCGKHAKSVALPPKFNRKREAVVGFINTCHLYVKARLREVVEKERISWALSYV